MLDLSIGSNKLALNTIMYPIQAWRNKSVHFACDPLLKLSKVVVVVVLIASISLERPAV